MAIAAGGAHSLVLRSDGTVLGWGWNENSQCNPPVSLSNVMAMAAGYRHSIALRTDGSLVAWGDNTYNQGSVPGYLPPARAIITGHASLHNLALIRGYPPKLFTQPQSQTAAAGTTVYISVRPAGSLPVTYQWYFGTAKIAGATNAVLCLPDVQIRQSGEYSVVVSNSAGDTRSDPALLSVIFALEVSLVPAITLHGNTGHNYEVQYINAMGPTNSWSTLGTVTLTNS